MRSQIGRTSILAIALLLVLGIVSATAGAVELTVTTHWGAGTIFEGLKAAVERFEELNPGVDVTLLAANPNKLSVMVAGGSPPDAHVGVNARLIYSFAKEGMLAPLDSFIERDADLPVDRVIPSAWQIGTIDGVIYGMPLHAVGATFWWNKEHFGTAGLDPETPPTLADFDDFTRRLTRNHPNGSLEQLGMAVYEGFNAGAVPLDQWSRSRGWDNVWDAGRNQYSFIHPAVVETIEWFIRYRQEYPPEFIRSSFGINSFAQWFAQGKMSMVAGSPLTAGEVANAGTNLVLGVSHMPSISGSNMAPNETWQGSIPVGAGNPDLAYQLLRFLSLDPEGSYLFHSISGHVPAYLDSLAWDRMRESSDPYDQVRAIAAEILSQSPSVGPQGPFDYRIPYLVNALNTVYETGNVRAALEEQQNLVNLAVRDWLAKVE